MILLQNNGKLLADRRLKFIGALNNDQELNILKIHEADPKDYKCYGEWYLLEDLKPGVLLLETTKETFRFIIR